MPTPVAPAWASLVVYVDVAVVLGAAVTALLATGRKQGTPGRASGGVWVAAAPVAWLGIVLALNSAHVFQARSHGEIGRASCRERGQGWGGAGGGGVERRG